MCCKTCRLSVATALLLGLLSPASCTSEPNRYVFISSPRQGKVVYVKIPAVGCADCHHDHTMPVVPLIDSGLKNPMGLAVDQQRSKLIVADPESRKVFSYSIYFSDGGVVVDGEPAVAVQDVQARWVACDGHGNIFVSDESANLIIKVPYASGSLRKEDTTHKGVPIYGANVPQVSAPGGVAVDNFHVFWSNKDNGKQMGSLVKGLEAPPLADAAEAVKVLAKNSDKVYGVCLVEDNVFYTDSLHHMYGVKKGGSELTLVSDKFQQPRGCAWDGDGTVYVADRQANAVFAFAGNMLTIAPARLIRVADFEGAFGVAVISGAAGRRPVGALLIALLAVLSVCA